MRKVIWKLFEIWPTAEVAAGASDDTMVIVEKLIQPLGLFRKRTIAIKRFSQEYLETDVRGYFIKLLHFHLVSTLSIDVRPCELQCKVLCDRCLFLVAFANSFEGDHACCYQETSSGVFQD